MSDLKNIFGRTNSGESDSSKAEPATGTAQQANRAFGGIKTDATDTRKSDELSDGAGSTQKATESGSSGQTAGGAAARFGAFLGKSNAGVAGSQAGKSGSDKPIGRNDPVPSESSGASADPAGQSGNDLDSLAGLAELDVLDSQELRPKERGGLSQFADEVPATAPDRVLPEDVSKEMLQFVDLINGVYDAIHDVELLGNVIKSIMMELKANPQYMKLVAPEDVHVWVRLMRDHMGLARIKKAEKAQSRGKGSKSKATDQDVADALASLGDIDFS